MNTHECGRLASGNSRFQSDESDFSSSNLSNGTIVQVALLCMSCSIQIMLKGLLFSELQQLMTNIGEKPGRAEILCGWLYHSGRLVRDVEETSGANSGHGDSFQRHRIGWKTRENIRACATADGGLELEVKYMAVT